MKLLYVSDIHHLNNYPKKENGYLSIFKNMDSNLNTLVKILDKEKFDLLVVGGDLCEDGSYLDYLSVKNIISKYDNLITLGNHDDKESFYEAFKVEKTTEKYHHIKYVDNYCFISFDNSKQHVTNGFVSDYDLEWLKTSINNNVKYDIIVLMHHHLFEDQHDTKVCDKHKEIFNIINNKVKLVLTAHTHSPYFNKISNTTYLTVGSLAFRAFSDKEDLIFVNEKSYMLIDLAKNTYSIKAINDDLIEYGHFNKDNPL